MALTEADRAWCDYIDIEAEAGARLSVLRPVFPDVTRGEVLRLSDQDYAELRAMAREEAVSDA